MYRLTSLAFGLLCTLVWAFFAAPQAMKYSARWPSIHEHIAHAGSPAGYYQVVEPVQAPEWGAIQGGR